MLDDAFLVLTSENGMPTVHFQSHLFFGSVVLFTFSSSTTFCSSVSLFTSLFTPPPPSVSCSPPSNVSSKQRLRSRWASRVLLRRSSHTSAFTIPHSRSERVRSARAWVCTYRNASVDVGGKRCAHVCRSACCQTIDGGTDAYETFRTAGVLKSAS